MKKLIILLLFLPCLLMAQPAQLTTSSTSTLLDSAATYNGAIESVSTDYNYVVIVVKSNLSSASNGLVVRWTNSNKVPVTYKSIDKRTYTANDTLNGTNVFKFPIAGSYFKVSYTNTTTDQTSFSLVTYLVKDTYPANTTGKFDVNVSGSALPTGAATAANQATQITRATADSLNLVAIKTLLDSLEADIATIKGNQTDGDQITQLKSSSNLYTKIGASVAALDSATFGFPSRHIGINNDESGSVVDSTTMYISTTSAFNAGTTFKLYAGENLPLDFACTKLYFKFGSTAKASKSYRFIVN